MSKTVSRALLASAVAAALVLSACGTSSNGTAATSSSSGNGVTSEQSGSPSETSTVTSSSSEAEAAPTETAASAQSDETSEQLALPEVAKVVVGVLPSVSSAPYYEAVRENLFAKYGLEVESVPATTGAAAAAALTSNSIQFGYGSFVPFIQAASQGLAFKLAAETAVVGSGQQQVLVAKDSDIETPADLKGKTIAVLSLDNYGVLAIRQTLRSDGLEPDDYKLVPIPWQNMAAALDRGQVDAAWFNEPYLTEAREAGNTRDLFDPFVGDVSNFPSTGFMVTADFAAKNPNTVAAFRQAINDGAAMINKDVDAFRSYIPQYSKTPEDLAKKILLPTYPEVTDAGSLQIVADLMLEAGMLKSPFDASTWAIG